MHACLYMHVYTLHKLLKNTLNLFFQHISAPLMEFERLKLIKRFKKEGEGENITIDYK